MHIHGPDISRIFITPDGIQQVFAAVHLVRIQHQKLQDIKFLGSQINLPVADKNASAVAVQLQVSCLHHAGLFLCFFRLPRAADDSLDSCLYLQNVEWLGDIVIGPVLQPHNLVHVLTFCRQHNDRDIGKFPYLLADLQAVHFRKHEIQQHNVIIVGADHLQSLFSVIGTVNLEPVLLQGKTNSLDNQLLIIYNKHFPGHSDITPYTSI